MPDDFLFNLFSTSVSVTAGSSGVDILQRKVQGKTETRGQINMLIYIDA
jgi:hypothetical protein